MALRYRYENHITPEIHQFIVENGAVLSDTVISKEVGLKKDMIKYYRHEVLNIVKTSGRKRIFRTKPEQIDFSVEKELNALIKFPYKGVMFESAMHRIKHLDKTLR